MHIFRNILYDLTGSPTTAWKCSLLLEITIMFPFNYVFFSFFHIKDLFAISLLNCLILKSKSLPWVLVWKMFYTRQVKNILESKTYLCICNSQLNSKWLLQSNNLSKYQKWLKYLQKNESLHNAIQDLGKLATTLSPLRMMILDWNSGIKEKGERHSFRKFKVFYLHKIAWIDEKYFHVIGFCNPICSNPPTPTPQCSTKWRRRTVTHLSVTHLFTITSLHCCVSL